MKSGIAYWDVQASTYAPRYEARFDEAHGFRIRLQRVCELLDIPEGRILDVGCGPGIMLAYLLSSGYEVFGVDNSEEMIAECRRTLGADTSANTSVGTIESLDFPDSFFDAVTCMGVVEYIPDDAIAVKEIARVTKPGGTIIITLPNVLSPYRVWDKWVYRKATMPVKKLIGRKTNSVWNKEYTAASYRDLLNAYGLVVTDVVYYAFKIIPSPLDILFRGLSVKVSSNLERLCRTKLAWLGTGFIIKANKA